MKTKIKNKKMKKKSWLIRFRDYMFKWADEADKGWGSPP
jgi:hypothetical protein